MLAKMSIEKPVFLCITNRTEKSIYNILYYINIVKKQVQKCTFKIKRNFINNCSV